MGTSTKDQKKIDAAYEKMKKKTEALNQESFAEKKKKLSKKAKEWIGQKQHIDYSGTNPTRPQGGWKD